MSVCDALEGHDCVVGEVWLLLRYDYIGVDGTAIQTGQATCVNPNITFGTAFALVAKTQESVKSASTPKALLVVLLLSLVKCGNVLHIKTNVGLGQRKFD